MIQVITECKDQRYAIADIVAGKKCNIMCRLPDGNEPEKYELATYICDCIKKRNGKKVGFEKIIETLETIDSLLSKSNNDDNDRVITVRECIDDLIKAFKKEVNK